MYNYMLKGKTALVSGASRGIGKAIAIKFAEKGAFIGINYLSNDSDAGDTLQKVKNFGSDGVLLKGDVSKRKDVENIVKNLIEKSHNIDILVNNAGIYLRHSFDKLNSKTCNKVVLTKLTGCYYFCKEVVPYMKQNSKIIFISSQLAFRGSYHGADYVASKSGMLGLMRSLSLELAEKKN